MNVKLVFLLAILPHLAGPCFGFTTAEKNMICPNLGSLAVEIMKIRQKGVPMSKALTIVPTDNDTSSSLVREIVIAAYGHPQYHTDKVIQQTVDEFRNKVEYECYK